MSPLHRLWCPTARILMGDRPSPIAQGAAGGRLVASSLRVLLVGIAGALLAAHALAADSVLPRSASPEGASVYFITPEDGQKVTSPVVVRFGLREMGVAPAGIEREATGHHHLIVDADLPAADLPVPSTDHYRHFGKGQTEVTLELSPGEHTLQLVLGDHLHIPHDPPVVSERITISVEAPAETE
jgi:hypothetical protein